MKKSKPTFALEKEYSQNYGAFIAGVDEVGRGAIAGPIVAAAVVFANHRKTKHLTEINDSKTLSPPKRLELDQIIKEEAKYFAIGLVEPEEIDKIGIGAANIKAFELALNQIPEINFSLIDGRHFRGFTYPYCCFEKGDSKSISIAAASIVAKVYRDSLMDQYHTKYPEFFLDHNKGYGCKAHYEALEKIGPTSIHRVSFLKKFREIRAQNTLF